MNRLVLAIIVALVYILLGVALVMASPSPHSSAYVSGVNAALNMTLVVGMEWREMGVQFSWEQLHAEVARRLGVPRYAPWRKKQ